MHARKRLRTAAALIALGATVGLACLSVAATTAGARDSSGDAGTARKDTLIVGQFRAPTGYLGNVYVAASDAFVSDGVHQLVYEPLFYLNPETGKEEPWLATGFTYNKSSTQITITLRKGVRWNDGVPLTSKDAVFTMNQILKTKPAPFRAGNIQASVASVRAAGPYAFVVQLKTANPRFIYTDLSSYIYTSNFTVLPEHIFRGQNFKTFTDFDLKKGWPIGTGPYRVTSASQNAVTLTRNDGWWAAKIGFSKAPAPKRVIFTNPGPEDTAVSNLAHNALDYAGLGVPTVAGFITAQKQNPKLVNWNGTLGWDDPCPFSLTLNTLNQPWNDPQMRWALNYSLSKSRFSQLFNSPGAATPAVTTFPAYKPLNALIAKNSDLLKKYPTTKYSPQIAAQILQSKGYKLTGGKWVGSDGKPLTVTVNIFSAAALGPVWQNADALVQQELEQAGFTVDMQPGDFNAIIAARNDGVAKKATWDAQSWFECGSLTDPWATLNRYTNALGNDNAGNWTNSQYNSIVRQIGLLQPTDKRIPGLFRRAFEIYLRELPVIGLNQRPTPVVANTTYWTGWPTAKNPWQVPAAWWQDFHQVVLHLKPAKG
jgi:peptide/nickel transport system substrate-binding protein